MAYSSAEHAQFNTADIQTLHKKNTYKVFSRYFEKKDLADIKKFKKNRYHQSQDSIPRQQGRYWNRHLEGKGARYNNRAQRGRSF